MSFYNLPEASMSFCKLQWVKWIINRTQNYVQRSANNWSCLEILAFLSSDELALALASRYRAHTYRLIFRFNSAVEVFWFIFWNVSIVVHILIGHWLLRSTLTLGVQMSLTTLSHNFVKWHNSKWSAKHYQPNSHWPFEFTNLLFTWSEFCKLCWLTEPWCSCSSALRCTCGSK